MARLLDVYIVASDGQLLGAYSNQEDADTKVEEIQEENIDYVTDEYGLDEDDDRYEADSAFLAGYEGGSPYSEFITINLDKLDREYLTSENDEFPGSAILSEYKDCGFSSESDAYEGEDIYEEDEDEEEDED